MHRRTATALLSAACLALAACGSDDEHTLLEIAASDGRFETLVGALEDTGLDETLAGPGPFTVFAPTDAAFDALPAGALAALDLTDVLTYHVVQDDVRASEVVTLPSAPTVEGTPLSIQADGDTVVLDGRVQVTQTDIIAENGVIHVIDAVLVPGDFPGTIVDALAASPRFSTLVDAVVGAGLADDLAAAAGAGGLTVFAPTNAAFERLPEDLLAGVDVELVLLYHVLGVEVDSTAAVAADGTAVDTLAMDMGGTFAVAVDVDQDGDLFLDGRTEVTAVDLFTSNGVIHALDSVLVPGGNFPGSVVEALTSYPRFDSLVDAVLAEDLAGAVTDVTVFAPTNDAFASADLMGEPLSRVLPYHLLDDVLGSGDLMATETTLLGETISLDFSSGVTIDGTADVIRADIEADDGIVHVIDGVLVPPPAGI